MQGRRRAVPGHVEVFYSPFPLLLLILLLVLVTPPALASVYIHNASATDESVQDLINSTISGDSIFLSGGRYPGSLIIDRPIILGALDSQNPPIIVADDPAAGIILAGDGITINGIEITGNATTGLLVGSNNNRISALTIAGFKNGIELRSAANNIFSNNVIVNNGVGVRTERQSRSNIFYLNRFDNTEDDASQSSENLWFSVRQDYQYDGRDISGPLGNSWKSYTGTDSNGDGVGDTPYTLQISQKGMGSTPAGLASAADRAPLVGKPESYVLIRSANATATLQDTPHGGGMLPSLSEGDQFQNTFGTGPYGGQQPATGVPKIDPGASGVPPPGGFPGSLIQYWWIIPILIIIAAAAGIWFGNSRRKIPESGTADPLRTQSPRNATLVTLPGQTAPHGGFSQDSPYFTVNLPPLLEKKYPGAEYLGEGGVGRVFRAWDSAENRQVAIKIPVRFDEVTGAQFTKELHIWQGLHHKNIVEVYAANVFPMPYIEMEFIESSLAAKKFPLELETALRIVTGIAEGLQYAHTRGIVHRDIKPENILITPDGIPKITDWGLAKALADTRHTGIISFSLHYAAPEQLAPNQYGDAGPWTDIYQLGVLFYEMVTGELPFKGKGMGEVTQAILHTSPLPPAVSGKDAEVISGIILKCIEKSPQDRFRGVSEILDQLRHLNQLN